MQTADLEKLLAVSYVYVSRDRAVPENVFGGFLPFVLAVGKPTAGQEFDPFSISKRLTESFGWHVGSDFVGHFVEDFQRIGFVKRVGAKFLWTEKASLPTKELDENSSLERLKQSFFEFSTELAGPLLDNLSAEERLRQLAATLVTNRLFSQDALEEYASADDNGQEFDAGLEYVSARYIRHCHRNERETFQSLTLLCQLGVICNLATYFARPPATKAQTKLLVALDGPFLVDLLGFSGDDRRGDAELIVRLARQRKARIVLFTHCIEEARDVIRGVINNHPTLRYGPTAAALRSGSVKAATLDAFSLTPRQFIENMKIADEILGPNDRRIRAESEYFTDDDWQSFYASLSGWHNEIARERDCDSVRNVMRIRQGNADKDPWKSHCVLLTSNTTLARLAKSFCVKGELIGQDDVGPAITRGQLAALLWWAGGETEKSEILSTNLLAAAAAFLSRDGELIRRVQAYAQDVGGERKELVDAFVGTSLTYELLQDATLGGVKQVDQRVVDNVLDRILSLGRREGAEIERQKLSAEWERKAEHDESAIKELRSEVEERAEQKIKDALMAKEAAEQRANNKALELEEVKRAAAELEKSQTARRAVMNILTGHEENWSKPYQVFYRLAHAARWAVIGLPALPAMAILVYDLQNWLGMILTGFTVFAGLWSKRLFDQPQIADSWAASIAKLWLARPVAALDLELGHRAPQVAIAFFGTAVRISNKEEIVTEL